MDCERCGRPAEFRLTEQERETVVCRRCVDRLAGVSRLGAVLTAFLRAPERLDTCPYCGCRDVDWRESGIVGCPLCYEVFQAELSRHFRLPV